MIDHDDELQATQVSRRRGSAPVQSSEETELARRRRPGPLDDAEDDATDPARRRTASAPTPDADIDDGSTVVVRRESRRRAEAAAASATDAEPAEHTVIARSGPAATLASPVPDTRRARAQTPSIYRPRTVDASAVPRPAPEARAPQEVVDTAAEEASRRRQARRRLAVVIVMASVIVVSATGALLALFLTG